MAGEPNARVAARMRIVIAAKSGCNGCAVKETVVGALSVVIAFIAALAVVAGILRDDKGPGNQNAAIGIVVVGIVGLFLAEFIGSLSH